jgi:hypothetical protein
MPKNHKKNKGNNNRKQKRQQTKSANPNTLAPVPRGIRLFNTTHKVSTSTFPISLLPNSGIAVGGLTTGYVIGIYFTVLGVGVYQPSVGLGTAVTAVYPNGGSYTSVFDIARIRKVSLKGYFSNNISNVSGITTNIPLLYSAVDYDGTSNPTTPGAVLSYDNSKVLQSNAFGSPCVNETFVPRLVNQMNNPLLSSAYAGVMPPGSWLDSTSYLAPHFGMFVAYDNQSANQVASEGVLTLIAEVHVEWGANR